MKKTTALLLLVILMLATMAPSCPKINPSGIPEVGFRIITDIVTINAFGLPEHIRQSDVSIFGVRYEDWPGATGSVTQLPANAKTDVIGIYNVNNGRAPAGWELGEFSGPCANQTVRGVVNKGGVFGLDCDITGRRRFFVASPMSIDLWSPPQTMTISGETIPTTYSMPIVEYYDEDGNFVASSQAVEVAPDGSSLWSYTPDLSSVYSGTYTLMVRVPMADGSWDLIGGATVDAYGRDEPQPPPDYCVHDGYCAEWDDVNCVCLRN